MNATDLVMLTGGISVPVNAYLLALALEARGVRLSSDGEDILVGPRDLLTDADRRAIRELKPHLRQIVGTDVEVM
jgi:hypothetical protein